MQSIVWREMKKYFIIIIGEILLLSCGNGVNHNASDDTVRLDSTMREKDVKKDTTQSVAGISQSSASNVDSERLNQTSKQEKNMRGFDPASEDDMDDNGMSRYMENDDDEGWD